MKSRPGTFLKRVFGYMGFVYLLAFAIFYFSVDWTGMWSMAKLKTLNRLRPQQPAMVLELSGPSAQMKQQRDAHLYYYRKVKAYIPALEETDLFLGYLYLLDDSLNESIDHLERGVDRQRGLFWANYNLAIAYYRAGYYTRARDVLTFALTLNPSVTLQFLTSSKLYLPLIIAQEQPETYVKENLQDGYRQAHLLLVLTYHQLQDYGALLQAAAAGMQKYPEDKPIYDYFAGSALFYLGDFERSAALLKASLDHYHDNPDVYRALALTLDRLGHHRIAEELRRKAALLRETDVERLEERIQERLL